MNTARILSVILKPKGDEDMGRPRGQSNLEPWLGKDGIWRFRPRVDVLNGVKRSRQKKTVMLGRDGEDAHFGERTIKLTGIRNARQAAAAYLQTINDTPKVLQQQAKLSTILDAYLREYVGTAARPAVLKPNTRASYRSVIESLIRREFGDWSIYKIGPQEVQRWVNGLVASGLRRKTVTHRLCVFSSIFSRAQAWGYLDQMSRNPCELVRIGECTAELELRALTPEECRRLLAAVGTVEASAAAGEHPYARLGARQYGCRAGLLDMVRVALFCGLRIGEILALTWQQYRPPELRVSVNRSQHGGHTTTTKSRRVRIVPLGPVTLARPAGSRDEDRIFAQWDYKAARAWMKRALELAGCDFTGGGWHTLRSTFATLRRGRTGLQDAMGHQSKAMTEHYIRPSFDDEDAVSRQIALMIGETNGRPQ